MGVDITVTVLGRKERDGDKPDTTYRALKFYRKSGDKYMSFDFPYFRNSFFFQELQNKFENGFWNGVRGNVENPYVISWYDESYEEFKKNLPIEERKSYFWGHGWIRLKDLLKWKEDLENEIEESDNNADVVESNEEIIAVIDFVYDSAKKMLEFDAMLEDRFEFEYDIDNSILLFAFDN